MNNRDVEAARDYHQATKLAYINLANKPPLYKTYSGLPEIPLPSDFNPPGIPTLDAVSRDAVSGDAVSGDAVSGTTDKVPEPVDLATLAQMLYFSAGILHKRNLPVAGEVHYRAAASAGALYPTEVYVVAGEISGLEAGVYHFSPDRFSLTQLREGDFRRELAAAAGGDDTVAGSPMTLVFTAVFWRSAWKYRVRSYRYCFWDAGTILANTLATVRGGASLPARLVTGFVDSEVNALLGLDSEREGSLCLAPVGVTGSLGTLRTTGTTEGVTGEPTSQPIASIIPQSNSDLESEISYPEIIQAHAASSLANRDEVVAWRQAAELSKQEASNEPASESALTLLQGDNLTSQALGDAIVRRGSTRRFDRSNISLSQFSAIMDNSTKPLPADFISGQTVSLLDPYLIVNGVDGLESGSYYFSPVRRRLELLKKGDFREEAGHLCFEQALGADSSAVVYFLADLDRILERYGNRGYRAAQLEAGVMAGNAYLCAHSLGLGATGMTFYDDDVAEFFSPHALGKSMMFLVAMGKTHEVNRVRPFRSKVAVLLDSLARGAGQRPGG